MRLTRARYITVCQQFLVTAVVLVVALSAAGVMTLQIVAPEKRAPSATGLAPAIKVSDAYVDTAPVTPTVREVKVNGIDREAARDIPGVVTAPTHSAARSAKATTDKPKTLAALSAPTRAHGYATVGVTWKPGVDLAESQIAVQVRTRTGGVWSTWTKVAYHDEHGPDAGSVEARHVRPGTDPVVVGDVDDVQMKAETTTGQAPPDLELAVIDPGVGKVSKAAPAIDTATLPESEQSATSTPPVDRTASSAGSSSGDAAALSAMTVTPKPLIYSRAQWGANEALRDASALRYGTIKTGFIHHTVNANNYTAAQVPALIRGIYAYHTQTRGWSDIGYNFLVDRFGRIWEGRYGGVARPVVGAHTLGYNEYSFAMSAIGNFEIAQPPQAVLNAYASLFAWKLSLSNIRADASHLWVKDRYLYAINGHRDVGQTACPGKFLYAKIPSIRVAAQAIQNKAQAPVDPVNLPLVGAPDGTPPPTQTPAPAVKQPALTLPPRISVAGSSWTDLVTKSASGAISVVPTGGILGFDSPIANAGPWSAMSIITAVGDVTGDGKGDVLAKSRTSGYTRVFRSDGRGHVSSTAVAGTYAFKRAGLIVAAMDFDRDGKNDVLARDRATGSLSLYRGKGHGQFASPTVVRKSWPFLLTAAAGDLNRDGKVDLVAVRSDNSLMFIPGKGGTKVGTALGTPVAMRKLPTGVTGLFGGNDATGDRLKDVMVRWAGTGQTTLYAGTGTGGLGQPYGPFTNLAGLSQATAAPMVGSAAPDVVGRNAAGRLVVVPDNGRRNLTAALPTNLAVPAASQVLDVGDWDRNGTGDVITREQSGDRLVLRPGLGTGKFTRGRSLGNGWATIKSLAAVGDITGDGYPDLIGKTATGPMTIFPGAGNNAFKAPVLAPASLRTYNQIGSTAWSPLGSVFASLNGTFVPLSGSDPGTALRTANGSVAPSYDTYVGVGDANGDGVADILAREKGTGIIWLLPGKTSGGFAPRVWVANGFAGYQLVG
jgi:hypothetical protein